MAVSAMAAQQPIPASSCLSNMITFPNLPGAHLQSKSAEAVTDFSLHLPTGAYFSHGEWNITNLEFCNVTISYTHVGHHDTVNVQVWLPMESWNGRMMGVGGGGWQAGLMNLSYNTMAAAVSEGYSAVSTDAGHTTEPDHWALHEPGKVNMHEFQDFASVALGDAAVIGKHVTENVYGKAPKYSYFNGCSTGGRQGLMLSQRYPEVYNGIIAAAPATNWPQFIVAELHPQLLMNEWQEYPRACELDALTQAAIDACDGDDGVVDGVIGDLEACQFDPYQLVGTRVDCPEVGKRKKVSKGAAKVAQAVWTGAKAANGSSLWYGLSPDAALTGPFNLANTECSNSGTCQGAPFLIAEQYMKFFLAKDPDFDFNTISPAKYEQLFAESVDAYTSIIGSNDPDLSKFKAAGGRMIMWHGLADQVIFPGGSAHYYQAVLQQDSSAGQYFRYFEAPGVAHCFGGPGPFPINAYESLVKWVEDGKPPEVLEAVSIPHSDGKSFARPLCPYPTVARHNGIGDPRLATSFYCADTYLSSTPVRLLWQRFKNGVLGVLRTLSDFQRATSTDTRRMRRVI